MNFTTSLHQAWTQQNSLLCVGLDPDPAHFPAHLAGHPDAIYKFCCEIVEATADLVCAYKPQIAYFSAHRAEDQLEALINAIHQNYPGIPVILDAKRGDIGATAEQYAKEAFERYQADAVTVNPYLGYDSLQPYLAYGDKGVVILCRTSNAGGSDLQSLQLNVNGACLYEHVAKLIVQKWNSQGNCALVVGATYPDELARVRKIVGELPILVPGIGAQGGDIMASVQAGKNSDSTGMIISASRAILYAGSDENFAMAARQVALDMRDRINVARKVQNQVG